VVSPCNAHPSVGVVYPEDPRLRRLLSADQSFHNELEKQCLGALPVLQPGLDPYILDVHWYRGAGENVQYFVTQCILRPVWPTQHFFSLWGYGPDFTHKPRL